MSNEVSMKTILSTDGRPLFYLSGNMTTNTDATMPLEVVPGGSTCVDQIKFVIAVTGVILGVLSILLNFAFLVGIQFIKNGNTSYHRLLQSLSLADALASLTFIIVLWPKGPLSGIDVHKNYTLAQALPYVLRSTPWMFFTGYLLTLSCLTINQYVAVCKPWKYTDQMMGRTVGILLVLVWIISSLQIIVPLVVLVVLYHHEDKGDATRILFAVSKIEIQIWMGIFLVSSLFNVLLDIFVYRRIRMLKLRRRISRMSAHESQSIRMKQEAFITVTLLLLASIFCRLPFPLMGIVYQNLYVRLSPATNELIHAVLVLLLYINFFVDPIIYIFRMRDVRLLYKSVVSQYIYCDVSSQIPQQPPATTIVESTQLQLLKDQRPDYPDHPDFDDDDAVAAAADKPYDRRSSGDDDDSAGSRTDRNIPSAL